MRQTNVRGSLSLRGFRKLRTGAIVATGVILLGLGFLAPTVSANEQDGVWVARTVEEVKADLQKEGDLFKYVIKWGDTLSVISEASNIPVDVLQEMNQASGKNLFLPHNELYFTEAETVSDTVTKRKIVIKESGASGEVRTYEVLLKKDQETKAVTFELTAVTEKVEKMTVNYSPVYQPVSAPIVGRAEESGEEPASEAPAVTSPEVKEETEAPVAPKAEDVATIPAPKETAPEVVTPAPKEEKPVTPAPKAEEPATPAPKVEKPVAPAPKAEESAESAEPKGTEPEMVTPAEPKAETPAESTESKATEPEVAKPAESNAEATTESTEASGTSAETTPKENETEGTTPGVTAAEGSSEATPGSTEEAPETTPKAEEKEEAPVDGTTSSEVGNAGETSVEETGKQDSTTNVPSEESSESESKAEDAAAGDTTVTEEQPATQPAREEGKSEKEPKVEEQPSAPEVSNEGVESTEPATESTVTEGTTPEVTNTGDEEKDSKVEDTDKEAGSKEEGKAETTEEASTTPSADATNESGNSESSSSVTDNAPSNTGAADQPVASNSSSESPATSTPKAEEPATTEPKAEELTSEEAKAKKELADSQKEGEDIINERVSSKLAEIEKVKDEAEKEKLKAELKTLKEEALATIKNAKNHDAAVDATDEYQTKIDEINVPGEELPAPNYNKDNLTNGRNEGTTIDNGSTAIGHGSGEAPSGVTQPASAEGTDNSSAPTAQPQPETTSSGTSSFRNAPSVQARARRVARSTSEPDGTVNISYNFAGMPDIHGFLSDPGENNTVTIPAGTSEAQAKELVKEKIQAKIKDLAARGYYVKNDIIFEQDTTVKNYNYVVTFTKEATGTSGFRMAPAVQPRASRNRRSLEQPAPQKVKVNVFYNFDQMKDIAGFLGDINGTSLEIAEGLSNEQVKEAVKSQVEAKKEELSKRGYTFKEDYVYQSNGKDYNYVVTFSKAAK